MINIVKSLGGALKAVQNPWSAAAAGAAGSLVSGLLSQRSADKSMRFQAEQTGTGYQRAMADMKTAGLNPMLAAKLGPASSGSGAQAAFPDIGKAVSSGFQASKMAQETERLKELTPIEAAKMSEEVFNLELTGRQIKENINKIMEETRKLGVVIDIEKLRMPEMKAMASFWETTGDLGQWLKAVEAAKNAGLDIGKLIPQTVLGSISSLFKRGK